MELIALSFFLLFLGLIVVSFQIKNIYQKMNKDILDYGHRLLIVNNLLEKIDTLRFDIILENDLKLAKTYAFSPRIYNLEEEKSLFIDFYHKWNSLLDLKEDSEKDALRIYFSSMDLNQFIPKLDYRNLQNSIKELTSLDQSSYHQVGKTYVCSGNLEQQALYANLSVSSSEDNDGNLSFEGLWDLVVLSHPLKLQQTYSSLDGVHEVLRLNFKIQFCFCKDHLVLSEVI